MSRAIIAASMGTATLVCILAMASSRDAVRSWELTRTQSRKRAVLHRIMLFPLSSTKPDTILVMCGIRMPTPVTRRVSPIATAKSAQFRQAFI